MRTELSSCPFELSTPCILLLLPRIGAALGLEHLGRRAAFSGRLIRRWTVSVLQNHPINHWINAAEYNTRRPAGRGKRKGARRNQTFCIHTQMWEIFRKREAMNNSRSFRGASSRVNILLSLAVV